MSSHLKIAAVATLVSVSTLAACGPVGGRGSPIDIANSKEAWNAINDPLNLRDQYEVRLAMLPREGDLDRKPWTDTYWPSYQGGLASRWNDPSRPDAFAYALNSNTQVRAMSQDALAQLSPAEKYDILMGNYNYPLVNYERRRTSPDDPSWFGLCHGWAPAALNFEEPNPVVMEGAGGVRVPFGSSDVKALLLFAQQEGRDTRFAGDRCNSGNSGDGDDPECRDINAGSFHVILANQIGLLEEGFVAEVNRAEQVWNHPVFGFTNEVRGESSDVYAGAAPGTVRIVTMRSYLRYLVEVGPRWEAMPFAEYPGQASERRYDYKLEINTAGEVVGGEWISADHPDFFWTQGAPEFTGYFREVGRIYEDATRD